MKLSFDYTVTIPGGYATGFHIAKWCGDNGIRNKIDLKWQIDSIEKVVIFSFRNEKHATMVEKHCF